MLEDLDSVDSLHTIKIQITNFYKHLIQFDVAFTHIQTHLFTFNTHKLSDDLLAQIESFDELLDTSSTKNSDVSLITSYKSLKNALSQLVSHMHHIPHELLATYWGAYQIRGKEILMRHDTRQMICQQAFHYLSPYLSNPKVTFSTTPYYLHKTIKSEHDTHSKYKNNAHHKMGLDIISDAEMLDLTDVQVLTENEKNNLCTLLEQIYKHPKNTWSNLQRLSLKKNKNKWMTGLELAAFATSTQSVQSNKQKHKGKAKQRHEKKRNQIKDFWYQCDSYQQNYLYITLHLHYALSLAPYQHLLFIIHHEDVSYQLPLEYMLMLAHWGIHYHVDHYRLLSNHLIQHICSKHLIQTIQQLACIENHLQSPLIFHPHNPPHNPYKLQDALRFESLIQLILITPTQVLKQCSPQHHHYWTHQPPVAYYVQLTALAQDLILGADLSIQRFYTQPCKAWLQISLSCDPSYIEHKEQKSRRQGCCGCLSPVSLARMAHHEHILWKTHSHTPTTLQGKAQAIRTMIDRILQRSSFPHPLGPIYYIPFALTQLIFKDIQQKLQTMPHHTPQKIQLAPLSQEIPPSLDTLIMNHVDHSSQS